MFDLDSISLNAATSIMAIMDEAVEGGDAQTKALIQIAVREAIQEAYPELKSLRAEVRRLDDELQNRSHEQNMSASDAYHHCADMIAPYVKLNAPPSEPSLPASVCESMRYLLEQWTAKHKEDK